jgi:hypothetical protein
MSIAINSNPERDQYQAAGGQTVFNFSFPIFSETYIKVYQRAYADMPNDYDDILTLGVDYTVTGVGEEAGGFITLTAPAVANDIITLVGEEPIDRLSVFTDYNPFTVALNQQLNEQTVMQQQTFTYWDQVTPRYYFSTLVSDAVRPLKRFLPMLPDGHVWVGRGEIGDNPDDITTAPFTGGGGGDDCCRAVIVQPPGGPVLSLGNWVRINVQGVDAVPGAYVPALATNAHLGERVGVVVEIGASGDEYTIQQSGRIADTSLLFPLLNTGSPYYLDTVTPGNMVIDDVGGDGEDSLPCFIPDSPTSGWVMPYRGVLVNGPAIGASGGGGGGDSNIHTVDQAGNTFDEGDWVYVTGDTTYSLTDPTTMDGAQGVGVVISPGDPLFTIQFGGWNLGAVTEAVDDIGDPIPIVSSTVYYLSSMVPGAITPTVPLGIFNKPAFISESDTDQSGWILPQRPLPAAVVNPQSSPWVFLGRLNDANNFSSANILQDNFGNTYQSYKIIVASASLMGAHGINGTGAGNVGIGFQLYIAGAWVTAVNKYASILSGVQAESSVNTPTWWGHASLDGVASETSYMVILPKTSTDIGLASGEALLDNNDGTTVLTFNMLAVDYATATPHQIDYTSVGTATCSDAGDLTGLRIYIDNGTLTPGSEWEILVYGIP